MLAVGHLLFSYVIKADLGSALDGNLVEITIPALFHLQRGAFKNVSQLSLEHTSLCADNKCWLGDVDEMLLAFNHKHAQN